MKRRVVLIPGAVAFAIAGYVGTVAAVSQESDGAGEPPRKTDSYFAFIYRPGPAWQKDKAIADQPSMEEHFAYMTKLQESHRIVLGGPFKDSTGAMGVLEVESLDAARTVVMNDPLVRSKVVIAKVHPWHPAISGEVEKRPW